MLSVDTLVGFCCMELTVQPSTAWHSWNSMQFGQIQSWARTLYWVSGKCQPGFNFGVLMACFVLAGLVSAVLQGCRADSNRRYTWVYRTV